MPNSLRPPRIAGLSDIAAGYRFLLCDVWGVVHNGVSANEPACAALTRFREAGGRVVLITNAPRPKGEVLAQLDRLGVPRAAYDDVITSGDVGRAVLAGSGETKVFHLGPERDLPIYAGLPIELTGEAEARLICCTGLFDDRTETPDDYMDRLAVLAQRRLPMICVNPDRVVERGDQLVWCAGALAERYLALGGETIFAGKPHAPIYDQALARLAELAGAPVDNKAVLAIGDGAPTDLRGAFDRSIDVLFVTDGIHALEFGAGDASDPQAVHAFLELTGVGACAFLPRLAW